jgi:ferredoxin-NADP reductase
LPSLPSLPSIGGTSDLPALPTIGPVSRRGPPGGARRQWQEGHVVEVRRETASAKTLRLWLPEGHPHTPGQHYVVKVTADDGSSASRSYSVASAPEPGSGPGTHIELTVERIADGDVSPYLHDEVMLGDDVTVRGPFGGWFVWRGDSPVLLLGGGSGVVPLMGMLRYWRQTGERVPLALVQSARSPDDLYYAGEYGPETTLVFTRSVPAGWPRPPARLDAEQLEPVLAPMRDLGATVFVCGSTSFAEHASQLAVELGVPSGNVRVERFGPS